MATTPTIPSRRRPALKPFLDDRDSIQPVFRVKTERTLHNLSFEKSIIEVAADRSQVEGQGQTVSFSELELELKEGTPADLFRLALAISTVTPLRLSFKTKAERGFDATSEERPTRVKAPPVVLKRKMTSAAAFQTHRRILPAASDGQRGHCSTRARG